MDELAQPVDDLDLVRLQVPDEVPAERIAVERVLLLEVLRAVLADDCHAGLGQRSELLCGDVLRGHDDRDGRADLFADAGVPLGDLGCARDRHAGTLAATSSRAAASSDSRPSSSPLSLRLPDLAEDLADLRRLRQPERDEIGPTDLETDAAEPVEVLAELRSILDRERQERRVGRERVGQRDDLRRRERLRTKALDDPRCDGHGADDPFGVASPQRQPIEPVVGLVGRHLARERGESDVPARDVDT